jgi:hypothetical protein
MKKKQQREIIVTKVDWTRGVIDRDNCTADGLRQSSKIALNNARMWADTAEQLLLKAADIREKDKNQK